MTSSDSKPGPVPHLVKNFMPYEIYVARNTYERATLVYVVVSSDSFIQLEDVALPLRFLSRVSIRTRDIDIANLSVCPSVCLSVCPSVRNVPVSDENG